MPTASSPLPSTTRLLRGVTTALAEMNVADRPDLKHAVAMAQVALGHLLARQDLSPYPEIYAEILQAARDGVARFQSGAAGALAALPPELSPGDYDAIQGQIGHALAALRDILAIGARTGLATNDPFVVRALAAEGRFYAATMNRPEHGQPSETPPPLTSDAFQAYLLAKFPGVYARLASFRRLVGGFQKETVLFEAERVDGGVEAMVIRAEKHDRFVRFTASEITEEYEVVRAMWDKGLRVAEPLWLEADPSRIGRRFMVSRRAPGGNAGDAMGSPQPYSPKLAHSFLATLARLHTLPIDKDVAATKLGGWLQYGSLAENTRAEVAAWRHQIWLDRAPASPGFERLFDWLEANVPTDEFAPCVVHNDYGPHNILVDADEVSAVLDWEVPRIGDPAEDLSYFLQCAGAAVDPEAAIALYVELSGKPISRYRLKYFDVLSCAKVLVSTLSATTMYRATDPALIDWLQMPILWHAPFLQQVEGKIAAAEQARGT